MMIVSDLLAPPLPLPAAMFFSIALLSAASLLMFAMATVEWLDARE
jgi:hypothetical protein